jgi:1-acyl-sn-glycerol-3-phosphate acyltransferase
VTSAVAPLGTLWRPASPCGADCLPVTGLDRAAARPVRVARLAGLVGVLLVGVAVLLPLLPFVPARRRAAVWAGWARAVLRALGIRLVSRGRLPRRRALLVANHISWLDIVALLAATPARLLAKQEVRGWPVIGVLAALAGTVFVDRSRPRTLPQTVDQVGAALRAGGVVAAFPEGTTWCGASSGRFRPALFQAAIDTGTPVVPVTVGYRSADGERTTAPAFIGSETLWASLRRVLALRGLEVSVVASAALHPMPMADRRLLARVAESAVRMSTPQPRPARLTTPAESLDLAA